MSSSKLRSRDRQRLRRHAEAALEGVPTKFVLEVLASRFGIADGRLEVKFRDGFLVETMPTHRFWIRRGTQDNRSIENEPRLSQFALKEPRAPGGTD
jgi:hypothetical protein